MYNKGKQFENQFFIYGPKCKTKLYFATILGALRGSSMIRLGLSCFPATCEIRKQSDKKFLSLNPKYEKQKKTFHIWGVMGVGGLTSNPGEPKFQGNKTS